MAKSFSLDLREKVIAFIKQGHKQIEASEVFDISLKTIYRWKIMLQNEGNLNPRPNKIRAPKKIDPKELEAYVEANPSQTLKEIAEFFGVFHNAIWYRLKKLGFVCKKNEKVRRAKWDRTDRI